MYKFHEINIRIYTQVFISYCIISIRLNMFKIGHDLILFSFILEPEVIMAKQSEAIVLRKTGGSKNEVLLRTL